MPKKYPVYLQLADLIERKINKNEYPLGSKIPSERINRRFWDQPHDRPKSNRSIN